MRMRLICHRPLFTFQITRDQIALMRQVNLANPDLPGFEALGIAPRALEELLELGRGYSV